MDQTNITLRLSLALVLAQQLLFTFSIRALAQFAAPEIVRMSPTSGPEGSAIEISGKNFQDASAVLLGTTSSTFKLISPEELIVLVPHKTTTGAITVVSSRGRASSPFPFVISNDPRIPDEASYKAGYVNPVSPPRDFKSAMLWGIAIADTRAPGYESAQVEIAWTQLSCRINGNDVVLNSDRASVRGGLYQRIPWFGSDQHEPMPFAYDVLDHAVILRVSRRPDSVWHFWSASPRAALPDGDLTGCTVKAKIKISPGALLQVGMDYWRNPIVLYGPGGNNHEAGASNWYFPSGQWQEATFTDIGGPQF